MRHSRVAVLPSPSRAEGASSPESFPAGRATRSTARCAHRPCASCCRCAHARGTPSESGTSPTRSEAERSALAEGTSTAHAFAAVHRRTCRARTCKTRRSRSGRHVGLQATWNPAACRRTSRPARSSRWWAAVSSTPAAGAEAGSVRGKATAHRAARRVSAAARLVPEPPLGARPHRASRCTCPRSCRQGTERVDHLAHGTPLGCR